MRHLNVDIETYSDVDIKKCGLYRYAQSPNFDVLLIAYRIDGGPVALVDLADNRQDPGSMLAARDTFLAWLTCPDTLVHAYNAAFEWYCLCQYMRRIGWPHDPDVLLRHMRCTMAHGLYCGYTAGLGATGEALGMPQNKRKLGVGASLIRLFCVPQKPTLTNGGRLRTLPEHEPEKWRIFRDYCCQDVEAESEIERRLSPWPMPEKEQRLWELDCRMNALGVQVESRLIAGALACGQRMQDALMQEAARISGLDNPKSVKQLQKWLEDEIDEELPDLTKATVEDLLKKGVSSQSAQRMLEIRQQISKTSTKKYDALARAICDDGRVRGLMQYYGANRTGRWAGRLIQPQNLPRNYLEPLDYARGLAIDQRTDMITLLYGNVPDTLSQLIRTVFIPSPGNHLVVADFSAIEARVIAWLAGEEWVNEVFATHGKIYEATASQMFHVPLELIRKGNPEYALRQKGKVATLALGYQGGVGAMIAMGALKQGLAEDELPEIVERWREANPHIRKLWYDVEAAALDCVRTCRPQQVKALTFAMEGDTATNQLFLTMSLPSGRKLFYARPFLQEGKFGKEALHFMGVNQNSKKWEVIPTFGGKLVENAVQAIARDCLAETLMRLNAIGMQTVFHVHDEVIIDYPGKPEEGLQKALDIMKAPIAWAPGLILKGAGFYGDFYQKD